MATTSSDPTTATQMPCCRSKTCHLSESNSELNTHYQTCPPQRTTVTLPIKTILIIISTIIGFIIILLFIAGVNIIIAEPILETIFNAFELMLNGLVRMAVYGMWTLLWMVYLIKWGIAFALVVMVGLLLYIIVKKVFKQI